MINWGRILRKMMLLPCKRETQPRPVIELDDKDTDRRKALEERADRLTVIASNVADRHSVSASRVQSRESDVRGVLDALLGRLNGEED